MKRKTVDGYRIPLRSGEWFGTWLAWTMVGILAATFAALVLFVVVRIGVLVFAP